MLRNIAVLAICSILAACSSSDSSNDNDTNAESEMPDNSMMEMESETDTGNSDIVPPPPPGGQTGAATATFRLTFNATWSAATHPLDYPANAHFSDLIGVVHNEQVIFWEPGQPATDGIELMAETGITSMFNDEIDIALGNGSANAVIANESVDPSPGSVSIEFDVNADYPLVTLVSMLAPSPDWFVGIHGLNMMDGTDFISGMTVDLVLYDAGTDNGTGYTSANADNQPRGIIARVDSQPGDSPFTDGGPSVGEFVIERITP